MSINRFDCELHIENYLKRPIAPCEQTAEHFTFDNGVMQVLISKKTGLIDKYCVNGVDMLKAGSAKINVFKDNEDPWGMRGDSFNDKIGEFALLSDEKANAFNGYPEETLANVRVIENGEVRLKIQAIFAHEDSFAVVTYTLPKNGNYVDIKIRMQSNNSSRFYKLSFDTELNAPEFWGQTAFGTEKLRTEGKEAVYQKWCGVFEGDKSFAVINKGTYGGSVNGNELNVSLLRTPVNSAHPIGDRPLADGDRAHDRIDIGEREFEYRITADTANIDMQAEEFNQGIIALSFFPSGAKEKKDTTVCLDNRNIILSCFCENGNGIKIRLYNSSSKPETTTFSITDNAFTVDFGAFEVKTFIFENGKLTETEMI